ncbi:MAG: hypothetical protein A2177_09580 [Spirochaetes bacterium RBG_13_68_11]|nr:MAG: hypothetical protein A2177_09580 [Spirochaetes bacterium RBG_13_68_11]
MDAREILARLRTNSQKIKALGAASIGLFGSFSTGNATSASDIDFIVHFERGKKTFDNYMELKFLLESLYPGYPVDLVIEDALKPVLRPFISETVQYAT